MAHQQRQFLRLALIVSILFVAVISVFSFVDYSLHSRYYSIRLGMTAQEVHNIVGAGFDA